MIFDIFLIVLGVAVFGVSHSYLASLKFKRILVKKIGKKIAFYRLFYTVFSTIEFFAILYLVPKINYKIYDLPFPYDIIVYLIQLLAFIALIWTGLSFNWREFVGINQIIRYYNGTYEIEELDEKPEFRVSGPFKYVRHPSYLFSIIFLGARPVMDVTYFTLFVAGTFYFIIGAYFEEKKLIEIYGETYAHYKKEVPFMIPKIKSLFNNKVN